jgi:hypothetical protein|tara:strand:- start:2452 stop:2637 length:186 start_codon:yes stop_codon:yes gene_type:complete
MFGSIDYFSLAKWMFIGFFIVFFPASIWFEDEIIAALDRRKATSKNKNLNNSKPLKAHKTL